MTEQVITKSWISCMRFKLNVNKKLSYVTYLTTRALIWMIAASPYTSYSSDTAWLHIFIPSSLFDSQHIESWPTSKLEIGLNLLVLVDERCWLMFASLADFQLNSHLSTLASIHKIYHTLHKLVKIFFPLPSLVHALWPQRNATSKAAGVTTCCRCAICRYYFISHLNAGVWNYEMISSHRNTCMCLCVTS